MKGKEFKCAFCKKHFIYDERVDIDFESKHKNHVCNDCYITMIKVILEGQCDSVISAYKEGINKGDK